MRKSRFSRGQRSKKGQALVKYAVQMLQAAYDAMIVQLQRQTVISRVKLIENASAATTGSTEAGLPEQAQAA